MEDKNEEHRQLILNHVTAMCEMTEEQTLEKALRAVSAATFI